MPGEETASVEVRGSVYSGQHSRLGMGVALRAWELIWGEGWQPPEDPASPEIALCPCLGIPPLLPAVPLRHLL